MGRYISSRRQGNAESGTRNAERRVRWGVVRHIAVGGKFNEGFAGEGVKTLSTQRRWRPLIDYRVTGRRAWWYTPTISSSSGTIATVFTAFVNGLNAYIGQAAGNLPVEFTLTG